MVKAFIAALLALPAVAQGLPSNDNWQNWSWSDPSGDPPRDPPATYMGLNVQATTEQLRKALGVADGNGALVVDVADGSPAAAAGLRAGDVVVQVAAQKVNAADIANAIRNRKAGDEVVVDYVRDRARRQATLKLAKRPEQTAPSTRGGPGQRPVWPGFENLEQFRSPQILEQRIRDLEERLRVLEEKIQKSRSKT